MIKKLLLLLFLIPNLILAEQYDYEILRFIDGDTLVFKAEFLPKPLKSELKLRIKGIDTPEKGGRAKCEEESILSNKAADFTKSFVTIANLRKWDLKIEIVDWGKYGGRVLGDILAITSDNQIIRLSDSLIKEGLARSYEGGKKVSWCK